MTISNENSVWNAVGDGIVTSFFFDNLVVKETDLAVYLDEVLKTITVDYTVSGAGTDAGSVDFLVPPGVGVAVAIVRNTEEDQLTAYPFNGPFPAASHEAAMDKLTVIAQDNARDLKKTLRFNPFSLLSDIFVDDLVAGKFLAAASDGLSIVMKTVAELGGVVISDIVALVDGIASAGVSDEISRSDHVHPLASAVAETQTNKILNDGSNFIHANGVHQACRNVSGGDFGALTVVYDSGWNAGQGTIEILKADANVASAMPSLGILDAAILNNANGEVLVTGTISDVDSSGTPVGEVWADMDILYVSETAGEMTNVRPVAAGSAVQAIASVLRAHAVNGVIFVQGAGRVNAVPNLITARAQIQWKKGADIASAAALPTPLDGNYADVTGVTNITSIATSGQIGTVIKRHFDGILDIVDDGDNIINNTGGLDITTAAGDEFEFTEYAAGKWIRTGGAKVSGESFAALETSGIAKAWANLNGDGVIALRDSFNIDSVTDNATGDYSFNFTNDFAAADYSVSGIANDDNAANSHVAQCSLRRGSGNGIATGATRLSTNADGDTSTLKDMTYVTMTAHGVLA